jgi:plasmid stability protein
MWNRFGSYSCVKTITLKNIPDTLHRTYCERARRHARSLNKEILVTLEAAMADGLPGHDAVVARVRQRVAGQIERRRRTGQAALTQEAFLDAIREGRE